MEIYPGNYCICIFNLFFYLLYGPGYVVNKASYMTDWCGEFPHLLTHPVLVYGPDGGNVCGKKLVLRQGGIASPGTDEPRLSHCVVPDNHTLDGLDIWPLIVHIRIHKMGPTKNK